MTGSTIKIDSSGDSEGNFSVLALKPYKMTRDNFSCDLHMVPVAYFQQGENFPVSEFVFPTENNTAKSLIKTFNGISAFSKWSFGFHHFANSEANLKTSIKLGPNSFIRFVFINRNIRL